MAQVIPIVFVGLLFEKRVLDREQTVREAASEAYGLLGLIVAECVALGAVYTGSDSGLAFMVVVLGTGFGASALLLDILLPITASWLDRVEGLHPRLRVPRAVAIRVPLYTFWIVTSALIFLLFVR